jgi:hypothetical protein
VCSKLGSPFVCASAGAGRSRGRCGGWPAAAAAGGDPAPWRTRGPATRRPRQLAAPGLALASLTIKASLSFLSLRLRSRFCHLSVPAQFLCNWGSSFEDFLLLLSLRSKTLARIRDVILCILSFIGQGSISCTPPDELSLLRVPCSRGPR